ncbi:hypothetical protein Tco_1488478, partial [Tanacetum coccineum]
KLYVKQHSSAHPTQAAGSSDQDHQYHLYLKITDDKQVRNADLSIWWSLKIKFEKPVTSAAPCQIAIVRTRDHEDHHDDDARPEGENSAKRQKTSGHGTYSVGKSSSEQAMDQEPNPSGLGTQEYLDEFDAYVDDFGIDDDELPTEEVSPELIASVSFYHNFQRDPKAPSTTLLNQDLFYLKYGQSGPKKYTLSLHKYPAVPFPKDDIEERTSRWVSKRIRRFNLYAQYSVEH